MQASHGLGTWELIYLLTGVQGNSGVCGDRHCIWTVAAHPLLQGLAHPKLGVILLY